MTYKGESYEATKYKHQTGRGQAAVSILDATLASSKLSRVADQVHIHFDDDSWLVVAPVDGDNGKIQITAFTPMEDERPTRPLQIVVPETATVQ